MVTRRGPVLTVEMDDGRRLDCLGHNRGKRAVVGDRVMVEDAIDTGIAEARVLDVAARRTVLARAETFGHRAKVIAANVECLFVVCAPEPPVRPGLIDRLLVAAHAGGMEAQIVLNKIDLFADDPYLLEEVDEALEPYPSIGYAVHRVSAKSGRGLDGLRRALADRLSVFVGHSGVGKTSLLNALDPGLGEAVKALSDASGRGVHTTTTASLFALPSGGEVIDSPGVRTFALWDIDPDAVASHFVEFAALAQDCRFANCVHDHEPGCAVKVAVEEDRVHFERYDSYLRIRATLRGEALRGA